MTDDPNRIRKLIRPHWPYSWLDEHWELMRYVLALLLVLGVWVPGLVLGLGIALLIGWRP